MKIILLVEDNPNDQLLAIKAFERNNKEDRVIVAKDGEEALDLLFKNKISPDMLLLDLKLPRISGFEILKQIRDSRIYKTLPVIILSTSGEEQDLLKAYNLGCNSYIRKPVDFSEFITAVKDIRDYWLDLNEVPHLHA